jgi:tetratricopeptide (TPR) repeat protein
MDELDPMVSELTASLMSPHQLAADENHSGTYYHLGKLYEQLGDHENALKVYEKGINIAEKVKAGNDLRELKGALSQLKDELDQ